MQSSQTRGCTSRGQCWRMPTFTNYCDVSCWYMCCCASLICSGQTLTCGYESAAASSAARLHLPTPQVPLKLTADFKTAKSTFPLWDKTVQSSTFVVVFILCALGIKDDQTFKKQPRGLKSSCITVIGTSLKTLHYESLQFLGSKLSLPHMFGDLTCCCISLTFCSTWLPHCYTLSCTVTRSCALLHALLPKLHQLTFNGLQRAIHACAPTHTASQSLYLQYSYNKGDLI